MKRLITILLVITSLLLIIGCSKTEPIVNNESPSANNETLSESNENPYLIRVYETNLSSSVPMEYSPYYVPAYKNETRPQQIEIDFNHTKYPGTYIYSQSHLDTDYIVHTYKWETGSCSVDDTGNLVHFYLLQSTAADLESELSKE